jgi:hypothetical protein
MIFDTHHLTFSMGVPNIGGRHVCFILFVMAATVIEFICGIYYKNYVTVLNSLVPVILVIGWIKYNILNKWHVNTLMCVYFITLPFPFSFPLQTLHSLIHSSIHSLIHSVTYSLYQYLYLLFLLPNILFMAVIMYDFNNY